MMKPTIKYIKSVSSGRYYPDIKTIYLNQRLKRPEFKEYHDTILKHELGHHKNRNNRIKDYFYELKEALKGSFSPKSVILDYKFRRDIYVERDPKIMRLLDPIIFFYNPLVILCYFAKKSIKLSKINWLNGRDDAYKTSKKKSSLH